MVDRPVGGPGGNVAARRGDDQDRARRDDVTGGVVVDLVVGIGDHGRAAAGPSQRERAVGQMRPWTRPEDDAIDDGVGQRGRLERERVGVVGNRIVAGMIDADPVRLNARVHRQEAVLGGAHDRVVGAPGGAVTERAGDRRAVLAGDGEARERSDLDHAVVGIEIDHRRVVDGRDRDIDGADREHTVGRRVCQIASDGVVAVECRICGCWRDGAGRRIDDIENAFGGHAVELAILTEREARTDIAEVAIGCGVVGRIGVVPGEVFGLGDHGERARADIVGI